MRPSGLDCLQKSGDPVDAGDQHIMNAAVAELGEYAGPKLGAFRCFDYSQMPEWFWDGTLHWNGGTRAACYDYARGRQLFHVAE
jgi:hypothetical protein